VRVPCLFKEYINQPDATRESFAPGGWFKTGDVVSVCYPAEAGGGGGKEEAYFRIMGRSSVDILKSG
jgi:acyl-CoA synthetase (AMP-forming)/AMP-acid ligase II